MLEVIDGVAFRLFGVLLMAISVIVQAHMLRVFAEREESTVSRKQIMCRSTAGIGVFVPCGLLLCHHGFVGIGLMLIVVGTIVMMDKDHIDELRRLWNSDRMDMFGCLVIFFGFALFFGVIAVAGLVMII